MPVLSSRALASAPLSRRLAYLRARARGSITWGLRVRIQGHTHTVLPAQAMLWKLSLESSSDATPVLSAHRPAGCCLRACKCRVQTVNMSSTARGFNSFGTPKSAAIVQAGQTCWLACTAWYATSHCVLPCSQTHRLRDCCTNKERTRHLLNPCESPAQREVSPVPWLVAREHNLSQGGPQCRALTRGLRP